jgi:hypothetical protein
MSKKTDLKLTQEETEILKDILINHQVGYSYEHPPERIVSVRSIIERLS